MKQLFLIITFLSASFNFGYSKTWKLSDIKGMVSGQTITISPEETVVIEWQ